MKRRSQTKLPKRDRELEQIKKLTTVSLTASEFHTRLLADKAALERRLRSLFVFRRETEFLKDVRIRQDCDDLIAHISKELRHVKAQLKQEK